MGLAIWLCTIIAEQLNRTHIGRMITTGLTVFVIALFMMLALLLTNLTVAATFGYVASPIDAAAPRVTDLYAAFLLVATLAAALVAACAAFRRERRLSLRQRGEPEAAVFRRPR